MNKTNIETNTDAAGTEGKPETLDETCPHCGIDWRQHSWSTFDECNSTPPSDQPQGTEGQHGSDGMPPLRGPSGTEGKPEDLSQYEVCISALLDVQKAYQDMFDVMPVAWQTFDDIVTKAIEQTGVLGAPDPNSRKRHN